MLNIALVCKYVAHMGHWPSGFSKINLPNLRWHGLNESGRDRTILWKSDWRIVKRWQGFLWDLQSLLNHSTFLTHTC